MAQQEDGWPFGLQQMNRSLGLARSLDSVSVSSSSSSPSSSDLDSEETDWASLGSTIHLFTRSFPSSIRSDSTNGFGMLSPPRPQEQRIKKNQTIKKPIKWLCSLCSNPVSGDDDCNRSTAMRKMAPLVSLGYLLEQEKIR